MIISLILSILLSAILTFPQENYLLEKELNYQAQYFTLDQLGYIYLLNDSGLKKTDIQSNDLKNFSNNLYGKIHSVDATDPFRTLIFYKDFNRIEWLDKNLSPILSAVSLDELGYYQVAAVCQSVNGGFWLFDQSLDQLVYYDKNLKETKKSAQLTEMIDQNTELSQVYMLEKNDYIYLGINGENILLFDNYGTYIKTFPIIYETEFHVKNQTIIYNKDNDIYFYNTSNFTEEKLTFPGKGIKQIRLLNHKIFVRTGSKIMVYKPHN